jgi:hypothetical protein
MDIIEVFPYIWEVTECISNLFLRRAPCSNSIHTILSSPPDEAVYTALPHFPPWVLESACFPAPRGNLDSSVHETA